MSDETCMSMIYKMFDYIALDWMSGNVVIDGVRFGKGLAIKLWVLANKCLV